MARGLSATVSNLRRRPAAERRILAAAAYAASASVVIALGVASISATLRRAAPPPGGGTGFIAAPTEGNAVPEVLLGPPAARAPEPVSPLAAIRDAGRALAESIGQAGRTLEEIGRNAAALPGPLPAQAPSMAPAQAVSPLTRPEPLPAASPLRPPDRPDTPARAINGLRPKPYSTYAAAQLLTSPLAAEPKEGRTASRRALDILAYNFRELSRAARDVYRYVIGE